MMDYSSRRERALRSASELGVEALVVSSPPNIRYLTGFTGEGLLLLSPRTTLCTDRRYEIEAEEETAEIEIAAGEQGHMQTLIEAVRAQGWTQVGFERDHLTFGQHEALKTGLETARLTPATALVETLRQFKDAEEVELIASAAAIVDRVLDALLPSLEPGPSEKEIALELTSQIVSMGAESVSFPPIVASGPRSALPHAPVTERAVRIGDILLLDLGAKFRGYCSDVTRTLALGEQSPEFCERYQAVLAAQRAGIEAARPGTPLAQVDRAAREVLGAAGMGEQFSHSLGHGVGLEVHESPGVSMRSERTLEVGHVFTIEPGVYFADWGGIRIEDLFVMEPEGPRQLTFAPKLGC